MLLFLLIICALGCTQDDLVLKDAKLQFTSQKWRLANMFSIGTGDSTKPISMAWKEHYIFNPDGTFVRNRQLENKVIEATGIFQVVEFDNDDSDYLELTYLTGNELIESCSNKTTELLRYLSANEIYNVETSCDGPSFYYVMEID